MSYPDLSEVGLRLQNSVEHLATVRPEDDLLQLYEEVAIAILDSEHMFYPDGALEAYLMNYLQQLNQ